MAVFGAGIGMSFMIALGLGPIIAAQFGIKSLFWIGSVLAGIAILLLGLALILGGIITATQYR